MPLGPEYTQTGITVAADPAQTIVGPIEVGEISEIGFLVDETSSQAIDQLHIEVGDGTAFAKVNNQTSAVVTAAEAAGGNYYLSATLTGGPTHARLIGSGNGGVATVTVTVYRLRRRVL